MKSLGRTVFSLYSLLLLLAVVSWPLPTEAQALRDAKPVLIDVAEQDVEEVPVPPENTHLVSTTPLGMPAFFYQQQAPAVADPASVYATTTNTFSGQAFAPAGQANTPAITRLMADDLALAGTPPFSIGRFDFSMCNLNAVAVSARPRVRFYLNNAGTPGNLITGFTFNPITVPALSCNTFFANVTPFNVTSNNMWAGMLFDNGGASTATAAQVDGFAMGIYPTPDIGTSADLFYRTTSAPPAGGSFLVNNPGPGALTNFSGSPVANFGWDFRASATIASITRDFPDIQVSGGNLQWTVTTTGASITGLTTSNFSLTTTGTIAGAAVNSVTANNFTAATPNTPASTNWTVVATSGSGTGTIRLNWANVTGLNTNVTNTWPTATGETYNILAPTASGVSVGGRVLRHDGLPIRLANLTLISLLTGESLQTQTDEEGNFIFSENVAPGASYSLTVAARGYIFRQPTRVISVAGNLEGVTFFARKRNIIN
jgi:hypothetical protein